MDDFQDNLEQGINNEEIIAEINVSNEKDYYKELKKKNKDYLVRGLTTLERERIARRVCDWYHDNKTSHNELVDKMNKWDETWRMVRKTLAGDSTDMPNYVTPLSTVSLETIHANIINVFFTPKDLGNVLPTEEGDIPKVQKLNTFMNWSCKNELDAFTNLDKLFHSSGKNGENPYLVHWVKEYGVDIVRKILPNPANPNEPLYDPDTKEPIFQEVEEPKLLYNAPKLEVFPRRDYIQPKGSMMGQTPTFEMRKVRYSYDDYLKEELQGRMYEGSIKELKGWAGHDELDFGGQEDFEGSEIQAEDWEKEFIECYCSMPINVVKQGKDDLEEEQEIEDEFIILVNVTDEVLCSCRKNRFPLKMRPIGMDYFMPDDEGRRAGLGVIEMLESTQSAYDALFNQFIFGTVQSNNPFGFFTPLGNQKNEPIKIKNGYLYPTSDPNSVNITKLPPPDASINLAMEIVQNWAQLLFGISSYAAGVESKIDPTAPAKKAEIVVAEGNVRMNAIIKRKNATIQDILKRWFLLYKENCPPNKYMRIVGESKETPWNFQSVTLEDFALKSIPDFELTGNVLNSNKQLVAQKAVAIYQMMIANPFFNPASRQGMNACLQLTKWVIDQLDEMGLSSFLPQMPGEEVHTPEEENARFLQGDIGEPTQGEDHIQHIKVHRTMLIDVNVPDEVKKNIMDHINQTVAVMKSEIQQQIVMSQMQNSMGGMNVNSGPGQGQAGSSQGVLPQGQGGMAGFSGGNQVV